MSQDESFCEIPTSLKITIDEYSEKDSGDIFSAIKTDYVNLKKMSLLLICSRTFIIMMEKMKPFADIESLEITTTCHRTDMFQMMRTVVRMFPNLSNLEIIQKTDSDGRETQFVYSRKKSEASNIDESPSIIPMEPIIMEKLRFLRIDYQFVKKISDIISYPIRNVEINIRNNPYPKDFFPIDIDVIIRSIIKLRPDILKIHLRFSIEKELFPQCPYISRSYYDEKRHECPCISESFYEFEKQGGGSSGICENNHLSSLVLAVSIDDKTIINYDFRNTKKRKYSCLKTEVFSSSIYDLFKDNIVTGIKEKIFPLDRDLSCEIIVAAMNSLIGVSFYSMGFNDEELIPFRWLTPSQLRGPLHKKIIDSWDIEEFRKQLRRKTRMDREVDNEDCADGGKGFLEINIINTYDFDEILRENEIHTSSSSISHQFENVSSLKLHLNRSPSLEQFYTSFSYREVSNKILTTFPNLRVLEIRGNNLTFSNFKTNEDCLKFKDLIEFKGDLSNKMSYILYLCPKIEKVTLFFNSYNREQEYISNTDIKNIKEICEFVKCLELNFDFYLANNHQLGVENFENLRKSELCKPRNLSRRFRCPIASISDCVCGLIDPETDDNLEEIIFSAKDEDGRRNLKWRIITKTDQSQSLNETGRNKKVTVSNDDDKGSELQEESIRTFICDKKISHRTLKYYFKKFQRKINRWIDIS